MRTLLSSSRGKNYNSVGREGKGGEDFVEVLDSVAMMKDSRMNDLIHLLPVENSRRSSKTSFVQSYKTSLERGETGPRSIKAEDR